jgi:hypothetical protein
LIFNLLLSFNSPCPPSESWRHLLMAGATFLSFS